MNSEPETRTRKGLRRKTPRLLTLSRTVCASLFAAGLAALMSGCPDLAANLDLKKHIENDVTAANAQPVQVKIGPESEAMGTTDPMGESSQKVGVRFKILATVNPDYTFLRWEQSGGNGEITFEDASLSETYATIGANVQGLEIVALYDARPSIILKDPDGGEGIQRNRPIIITFSEDVDPATVTWESISVTARSRNSTADPVSIADRLDLAVDGPTITLSLKSGQLYDGQNYIWVKVLKSVTDSSGNGMKDDFSWYFITGNSADLSAPSINSLDLTTAGSSTALSSDEKIQTRGIVVNINVSDDGTIRTVRINETALTDINDNAVSGSNTKDFDYSTSIPYTLVTAGDGRKRIEVLAIDTFDHVSDPSSQTLIIDTTAPIATVFSASYASAGGGTVTVTQTVGDGTLGSGGIQVSFSVNNGASWNAYQAVTSPYVMSPYSGGNAIWARYIDALGNETPSGAHSTASIIVDNTPPTIDSFTIESGAAYALSATVTLAITASDTGGSGIAAYLVNENSTPPAPATVTSPTAPTSYTLGGDGPHTLYAWVKDGAGNVNSLTAQSQDSINLDTLEPTATLTVSQASPTNQTNLTITVAGSDANGIAAYLVNESSTPPAPASVTATPAPTSFTISGEGSHTLYAWVKDNAGNVSALVAGTSSKDITLDTIAPVITTGSVTGTWSGGSGTVALNCPFTDATGIKKIRWGLGPSLSLTEEHIFVSPQSTPLAYTLTGFTPGTPPASFDFEIEDAAGNVSTPVKTLTWNSTQFQGSRLGPRKGPVTVNGVDVSNPDMLAGSKTETTISGGTAVVSQGSSSGYSSVPVARIEAPAATASRENQRASNTSPTPAASADTGSSVMPGAWYKPIKPVTRIPKDQAAPAERQEASVDPKPAEPPSARLAERQETKALPTAFIPTRETPERTEKKPSPEPPKRKEPAEQNKTEQENQPGAPNSAPHSTTVQITQAAGQPSNAPVPSGNGDGTQGSRIPQGQEAVLQRIDSRGERKENGILPA
jgi:hypothetical protein